MRCQPLLLCCLFSTSCAHPLNAVVEWRKPLVYQEGADPTLDRPPHVRAASGLASWNDHLAIIQDDAGFLAFVSDTFEVKSFALPASDGVRLFDDTRGNRLDKLDLESCLAVHNQLLAFGSGASPKREKILRVRARGKNLVAQVINAGHLYAALHDAVGFSDGALNIEGVALIGDKLRFFQRAAGRKAALGQINATIDVSFSSVLALLEGKEIAIRPENLVRYDLGKVGDVSLAFTDAAAQPDGSVLYLATAENTGNTIDDGAVLGSAVGVIARDGTLRWSLIRDESGAVIREKVEGILLNPKRPDHAFVVTDTDDPNRPAELLDVHLDGDWR